jgi:transposase
MASAPFRRHRCRYDRAVHTLIHTRSRVRKSAATSVIKLACRYEPEATSTYEDLARHYTTAILPARPFHPRDKPAVEASVLLVQRWILARLRHRKFFSLKALNAAIRDLLGALNNAPVPI